MEYLKKSLGIKIGLFVILQVLVVMSVLSGIVIGENLSRSWYGKSRDEVSADIFSSTGAFAAHRIVTEIMDFYTGISPKTELDRELIEGEEDSPGFGYSMYLGKDASEDASGENTYLFGTKGKEGTEIRQVHKELDGNEVYKERQDHGTFVIEVYLALDPNTRPFPEEIKQHYSFLNHLYQYRNYALGAGIPSILAALAILILLIVTAGRRKEAGEQAIFRKLPLDLLAGAVIFLIVFAGFTTAEFMIFETLVVQIIMLALGTAVISFLITGFILILSAQVKYAGWWKASVIYRTCRLLLKLLKGLGRWIGSMAKQLPLVWKTAVAVIILFFINLFLTTGWYYNGFAAFCWLLQWVAMGAGAVYIALCLKRLKEGGKHLAEGDLSCKVNTKGLYLDFAEHAAHLNSIGDGMAKAVEERLKSERFKTELITNVSHDIKTPLTSIINYVDFLKQEELGSEKAREYVEVLDRQAGRLKKLTEDLVDASKAATGTIKMDLAPCQVGVLMSQTMGEYEEKAEKSQLQFIMKLPEEDLEILADGRRLWRVFDNLLSNICKYSQPGSRVYLNLEEEQGRAVITYKNMSKYELNITEEELMERFVRGDSSRHTEGSGLGLSIADNLTELMGGTFQIQIDGDLFKTVITFPLNTL